MFWIDRWVCQEDLDINLFPTAERMLSGQHTVLFSLDGLERRKCLESEFVIKNGKLKKYIGEDKIIKIPDGVKKIGSFVFSAGVEEVIIPEGVTEVSDYAFVIWSIRKIMFPDGIKRIGPYAFYGCGLEELLLPDSVEVIESCAFNDCIRIKKIRIADSIQKVVKTAFWRGTGEEPDWFVRDWEIEIVPVSNNKLNQEQLTAALRYDNLAYTFLRGKLTADESCINLITKWLGSKANRKIIVEAAVKRNDQTVIDTLFGLDFRYSRGEINDYITLTNAENKTELSALILSGVNRNRAKRKEIKKAEGKDPQIQFSDQEKVKLLETAVLNNDIESVNDIFGRHAPIVFTARALGLACRFAGSEMVNTLIEHGATFEYFYTPAMAKYYDCGICISHNEEMKKDYVLYLFPGYEVSGYPCKRISDREREKVLRVLFSKKEGDIREILYYAIFYHDTVLQEVLKQYGINRLSDYRTDIVSGRVPATSLDRMGRYYREEFYHWCQDCNDQQLIASLEIFLNCMDVGRIAFRRSFFYYQSKSFFTKYCSQDLFEFFALCSNMTETVPKSELLCSLIDKSNLSGLQYAIKENWIDRLQGFEELLEYARKTGADPEIKACIADAVSRKISANTNARKTAAKEIKPLSASELKKIWGTKIQEDGTIMITSYKGSETNITVPSAIGKSRVTAVGSMTFSSEAGRISEIQKRHRKSIISVEFPGSIKEIPEHLFYEGYPREGRSSLKKVIINEGTVKIGKGAFEDCSGIEEIILPDSVTEIGDYAFSGCRRLKKVRLPKNLDSLKSGVFKNTGFTEFVIPGSVKSLGYDVFSSCKKLRSVTISGKIKIIPEGMFEQCSSLTDVSLHKRISKIEQSAFEGCSFDTFIIPASVKTIGDNAFSDCRNLRNIVVPENTVLGNDVFSGCVDLADGKGLIIFNKCLCGIADRNSESGISDEFAITPLYIGDDVEKISVSTDRHPIVLRPSADEGKRIDVDQLSVGGEVLFGRFPETKNYKVKPLKWKVIAKQDGRALLVTDKCIMNLCRLRQRGIWVECTVRKMLNDGFYNAAFTGLEQEQIVMSLLKNPENKSCHADGGPDTNDRVFLLNTDEVQRYMPETSDRETVNTVYAAETNSYLYHDDCWMLRTPVRGGEFASVSLKGRIQMSGPDRSDYCYIRPAIWIQNPVSGM